jgi:hypothetical protein
MREARRKICDAGIVRGMYQFEMRDTVQHWVGGTDAATRYELGQEDRQTSQVAKGAESGHICRRADVQIEEQVRDTVGSQANGCQFGQE